MSRVHQIRIIGLWIFKVCHHSTTTMMLIKLAHSDYWQNSRMKTCKGMQTVYPTLISDLTRISAFKFSLLKFLRNFSQFVWHFKIILQSLCLIMRQISNFHWVKLQLICRKSKEKVIWKIKTIDTCCYLSMLQTLSLMHAAIIPMNSTSSNKSSQSCSSSLVSSHVSNVSAKREHLAFDSITSFSH
jgi:hypothetical protein